MLRCAPAPLPLILSRCLLASGGQNHPRQHGQRVPQRPPAEDQYAGV